MTFLANPQMYQPADIPALLAGKTWRAWTPSFMTVHNTAVPTLAQWMDPAHTARQRVLGQEHYERDILHWHSGVHFFVAPDGIWNLCEMTEDGVHASCFNHHSFGMEMIGDFARESFTSGPGALVRRNAIGLMAAIHVHFGWNPLPYVYGVRGLHFHKDCVHDHHACPGANVVRADLVAAVVAEMARLRAPTPTTPVA